MTGAGPTSRTRIYLENVPLNFSVQNGEVAAHAVWEFRVQPSYCHAINVIDGKPLLNVFCDQPKVLNMSERLCAQNIV